MSRRRRVEEAPPAFRCRTICHRLVAAEPWRGWDTHRAARAAAASYVACAVSPGWWCPQKPVDRRSQEVAKAVGGGYCRLQMPLPLPSWRPPPFQSIPAGPPQPPHPLTTGKQRSTMASCQTPTPGGMSGAPVTGAAPGGGLETGLGPPPPTPRANLFPRPLRQWPRRLAASDRKGCRLFFRLLGKRLRPRSPPLALRR